MSDRPSPPVALVVVVHGEYEHWDPLPETRRAAEELAHALDGKGYELNLRELLGGGTREEVARYLSDWFAARSPSDRVVLYWAGHATENGETYLVTRDSPRSGVSGLNALTLRDLGHLLARSEVEKLLVLLDTTYFSAAAPNITEELWSVASVGAPRPGQVRFIAFLPWAHALEKVYEGAFPRALLGVLTDPGPSPRAWSDNDEYIPVSELAEALIELLCGEIGPGWPLPIPLVLGVGERFLPNPRFRPDQPSARVESRPIPR